jgi:hypothetical protein
LISDVFLGEVKLVAPFPYVGSDPVPSPQLFDRCVFISRFSIGLTAPSLILSCIGSGSPFRADATTLVSPHAGELIDIDKEVKI